MLIFKHVCHSTSLEVVSSDKSGRADEPCLSSESSSRSENYTDKQERLWVSLLAHFLRKDLEPDNVTNTKNSPAHRLPHPALPWTLPRRGNVFSGSTCTSGQWRICLLHFDFLGAETQGHNCRRVHEHLMPGADCDNENKLSRSHFRSLFSQDWTS